ncbi:eukaryotic translation initiation factor 4E1 [Drosophila rhopaloa]|uniref:eIF-4F 25 kDa subunit n=1 Tax=Drosophila rhopaloa TaxID=1041015 RepID=A0A6P4FDQ9_DRORH|nr:eukaryotic translation initiation factor 4E1 [Drosophila rhopaloa]
MDNFANTNFLVKTKKGKPPADESSGGVYKSRNLKKHQLQNTWTLWFLEYDASKSWEDLLSEVDSFSTVEDFWRTYYRIKPPSKPKSGCDYMLFKKGIRPMWEDPSNIKGGRWLNVVDNTSKADLDIIWLDVMLCLIGEACDHCDQICGASIRIRRKVKKVSIWTNNGKDEEAILEIGHKLCELVRLGSSYTLQYQGHMEVFMGSELMYKLKVENGVVTTS